MLQNDGELLNTIESDDEVKRNEAARKLLLQRTDTLQSSGDYHKIDKNFISCAEYQLFLDEKRKQNKFYQPDHWTTFIFPKGQSLRPITGVRPQDAIAFCDWLSQNSLNQRYRLPTSSEAQIYPALEANIGTWCCDGAKTSLMEVTVQPFPEQLPSVIDTKMPVPLSFEACLNYDELTPLIGISSLLFSFALQTGPDLYGEIDQYFGMATHFVPTTIFAYNRALTPLDDFPIDALNFPQNSDRASIINFVRSPIHIQKRLLALIQARTSDYNTVKNISFGFKEVATAVSDNEYTKALDLVTIIQTSSDIFAVRRATLIKYLLIIALSQTMLEWRQAYRYYLLLLCEYAYYSYGSATRQFQKKNYNDRYTEAVQVMLNLYWRTQIILGREKDSVISWGGIRIVRDLE